MGAEASFSIQGRTKGVGKEKEGFLPWHSFETSTTFRHGNHNGECFGGNFIYQVLSRRVHPNFEKIISRISLHTKFMIQPNWLIFNFL